MSKDTKFFVRLSFVVFPLAFLLLFMQVALLVSPMSWWIEYEDVIPLADKIGVGTKPRFKSVVEINKECNLHYNDIMFCKPDGMEKFTYSSEYFSTTYGKKPGKEENEWTYGHKLWDIGECYLKSNIILMLPFGVEKVQTVIGAKFRVDA